MRIIALIMLALLVQAGHAYDDTMIDCAARENWKCVFAQLHARTSPNKRSPTGVTALHYAAKEDYLPAMQALIAAGANVNATDTRGNTPAHFSAASWDEDHAGIAMLAEAGADLDVQNRQGRASLDWALMKGRESAVVQLLKAGADPGDDSRRIAEAVEMSMTAVQAFLDAGAELPPKDASLMHTASADVVLFLAEQGFDPNTRRATHHIIGPNPWNGPGPTPLHSAAMARSAERIRALIDAGADPHVKTTPDKSLFRVAIKSGAEQPLLATMLALLQAGLDPDVPDEDGFMPLHHAALSLDGEAVVALLAYGANPLADDNVHDATPREFMHMVEDQLARRGEGLAATGLLSRAERNQTKGRSKTLPPRPSG